MRFLNNPRIYIYSIVTLAVCGIMIFQQKKVERMRRELKPVAQPEIIHQAPVAKPAEMKPADTPDRPKLYLFGTPEQLPYVTQLREALKDSCGVLHIVASDAEVQKFFGVSKLPAAILYDKDNKEIARQQPPLTEETLRQMVQQETARPTTAPKQSN